MKKQIRRAKQKPPAKVLSLTELGAMALQPAPVDVWLAAVQLYQAARRFTSPVQNPEQFGVTIGGQRYQLTDIPINRGMLAIRELVNGDPELFAPIAFRCMALGGAMKQVLAQPRFAPFFKEDGETKDYWIISDNLLGAFARATFDGTDFDMDSVYEHADQLRKEDELRERAQAT